MSWSSELEELARRRELADGLGGVEESFELVYHGAAEDVLDGVGVAVHVAGGDVGVGDEVHLPEAVVADDAAGFGEAQVGEANLLPAGFAGEHHDQAVAFGAAKKHVGLYAMSSSVLEGLAATKKIGRTTERGYQAADQPTPRRPARRDEPSLEDMPPVSGGKKKYYN